MTDNVVGEKQVSSSFKPNVAIAINGVALCTAIVAGAIGYGRQIQHLDDMQAKLAEINVTLGRNAELLQRVQHDVVRAEAQYYALARDVTRLQSHLDRQLPLPPALTDKSRGLP